MMFFERVEADQWRAINDKGLNVATIKRSGDGNAFVTLDHKGMMPLSVIELVTEAARMIGDAHPLTAPDGYQQDFTLEYTRVKLKRQMMDYVEKGGRTELGAFIDGVRTALGKNN